MMTMITAMFEKTDEDKNSGLDRDEYWRSYDSFDVDGKLLGQLLAVMVTTTAGCYGNQYCWLLW